MKTIAILSIVTNSWNLDFYSTILYMVIGGRDLRKASLVNSRNTIGSLIFQMTMRTMYSERIYISITVLVIVFVP